MTGYQNTTPFASLTCARRQVTKRDLERAMWRCRRDADAEAGRAIDDLLIRYDVTAWRLVDQIEPERRREFYTELQTLVASLNERTTTRRSEYNYPGGPHGVLRYISDLPQIDFAEDEISYDFLAEALRHRDHPKYAEAITAAILKHANGENSGFGFCDGEITGAYPELHLGSELEGHRRTLFQVQVIRDIAAAMHTPVEEFVRQCARDCGEPVPECFGLTARKEPPRIVFPSLSEARATTPKPAFVVDRLIPDRAVTLAHGPTGRGKTYWCLELAAAVAAGRPAFGHFQINRPGFVVFFEGENFDDVLWSRVPAFETVHGSLDGKMRLVPYALPLIDDAALQENLEALRWYASQQPIALLVNDTYRESVGEERVNDDATAAAAYRKLNAIAQEFGCAVLCTAHAPKHDDNGIAGSQVLEDRAPWTLLIKGRQQDRQLITVEARQGEKSRIDKPITPFTVDCQAVELEGGGSNLILTGYREKAAKAAEEPATAERPTKAQSKPPVVNGNAAEILERHSRGDSASKIAKDMQMRKATVLEIIRAGQ